MKTRAEAAIHFKQVIEDGHKNPIPDKDKRNYRGLPHHWGKCEFRELMDFIYGGAPTDEREYL